VPEGVDEEGRAGRAWDETRGCGSIVDVEMGREGGEENASESATKRHQLGRLGGEVPACPGFRKCSRTCTVSGNPHRSASCLSCRSCSGPAVSWLSRRRGKMSRKRNRRKLMIL